ncbi:MAG: DNA topoisomerase [Clostridium sp.]
MDTIYVCTDSGREGEYIYRLVAQMAGVKDKHQKRVWIDSQTEEEILRGIREAKDESEYDNLSASAYLRAKGRLPYGNQFLQGADPASTDLPMSSYLGTKFTVLSVGRVMTCVLGMVVRREREIRSFVKTPFYSVIGTFEAPAKDGTPVPLDAEWKAVEGSKYFGTPYLYKDNGFKDRQQAEELIAYLEGRAAFTGNESFPRRRRRRRRIRLFFTTWRSFRMTVPRCLKSVRMRRLKVVQELYEKRWSPIPELMPEFCPRLCARRFIKTLGGLIELWTNGRFCKRSNESWKF